MDAYIFVDADAMPKDAFASIVRLGTKYQVRVISVSSINHQIDHVEHITVDALPQATDMKIVALVHQNKRSIVVTQDYGLAALVLAQGAMALSPNGLEYTNDNIDRLLAERALHAHERKLRGRNRGPKPRTQEQRDQFARQLERLITFLQDDH